MPFQLSPGVNVSEIDLTTIVPAVATTDGAIGGVFRWGPIEKRTLVDSETALVTRFGKPTNLNAETWMTAASFLGYGNRLHVSRAANTVGTSPIATGATITSNTVGVVVASTTGLSQGMIVISAANSTVQNAIAPGATIAAITNSTHLTLSTASDALINMSSASIQFVTNTTFTAVANTGTVATLANQIIENEDHFLTKTESDFDSDVYFAARFPGEIGNSIRVSVCANASGYTSTVDISNSTLYISNGSTTHTTSLAATVNSKTATVSVAIDSDDYVDSANTANNVLWEVYNALNVTDRLELGNTTIGTQYLKISALGTPSATGNSTVATGSFTITFDEELKLSSNVTVSGASGVTSNTFARYWEFFNVVDAAPGNSDYQLNFGNTAVNSDEMHVVVVDDAGKFTGVPGTILEVYEAVSRATDAKNVDGAANYFKEVINDASQYIYAIRPLSNAPAATAENLVSSTLDIQSFAFKLGRDGANETTIAMTDLAAAYDQFASAEEVDISLVLVGKSNSVQLANYLIDNIAEVRKDCVVFVSPQKGHVVNNVGNEADSIVNFRNSLRSTSYAVLDSGYKYMYDRYNDVYRWVPLNGDVAGLCVRTDTTNDPWWSPAGLNRGQIKNLVRLAYNPRKADRDTLYKNGANPVVTFPGQGTVLFGDKTLLSKPSAFDRINVRRLFIVLEKAIATASKFTLFEFNDAFTRSQFKNLVVPYLRDVQGRRGIQDFLVVCDESNNTPEIIDRNEFVGDIYIKPARSINFIQLNFVAVRSGVAFSEVVGQF
jgi:phage tail sheath protein FI